MPGLSEVAFWILLLLFVVAAFSLGCWAALLSSEAARTGGLIGVLLLVLPVYTGWLFLSADQPGSDAFAWWVVGLSMAAPPWIIAAIFGFAICAMRRR